MDTKIPKVVHKIWVGDNPMPEKLGKYTDTWQILKDCGYTIKECNNSTVSFCRSVKESRCLDWACENNKYTIINHYIRYWLMYCYGGVYMDLDVQVTKSFDRLLDHGGCIVGMESERWINNHAMMSEPGHPLFKDCMEFMDNMDFAITEIELTTGPRLISNLIYEKTSFKYRFLNDTFVDEYEGNKVVILPERYLSGHRWYQKFDPKEITEDTFCVHHYEHTWK